MKIIKLYSKSFAALTTLTETDFIDFEYRKTRGEIGDCSFRVRLDRNRINDVNLKLYNRVEFFENGEVKFIGVITRKRVLLDTAEIRCRELTFILKKRIMADGYTLSGSINDAVATLLTAVNTAEASGITAGTMDGVGTVNNTFNRADAWTILKDLLKATGNQFELNANRQLVVSEEIGIDKSASVIFRYNVDQISSANILKFEVDDDGEDIVTKAYGVSGGLTATEEDTGLKTAYGLLEKFRDFRVANTQSDLDNFTEAELKDRVYSPNMELSPKVKDEFNVGDTVRIRIKNALVNINDSFQILEKRVRYNGDQKRISVRINDLPNYLSEKLSERDKRLELLEKHL